MPIIAILIISFLFLLSFGVRIFHPGIYWDDYTMIGVDPLSVKKHIYETGRPMFSYIHYWILKSNHPIFLYKLLSIVGELGAVFFIGKSLLLMSPKRKLDVFIICLFAALVPIYQSRESLVLVQYSLSSLFLYSAIYLLLRYQHKFYSLISFFLLLLAYDIQANILVATSLLCLFGYLDYTHSRKILASLIKYRIIIASLATKTLLILFGFKASGQSQGINQLNLSGLKQFSEKALGILEDLTLRAPDKVQWDLNFPALIILSLIAGLIVFFYLNKNYNNFESLSPKSSLKFFAAGTLLIWASVFAFYLVNKPPSFYDWNSRGQFAAFLGSSLVLYSLIQLASYYLKTKTAFVLIAILVGVFTNANLLSRLEYYRDYLKQRSLIQEFAKHPELKKYKNIKIIDHSFSQNANKRTYRFYEFTGIFKRSFGNESRLVYLSHNPINEESYQNLIKGQEKLFVVSDLKSFPKPDLKLEIFQNKNMSFSKISSPNRGLGSWLRIETEEL